MRRLVTWAWLTALAVPGIAAAQEETVMARRGTCDGGSTWRLRVWEIPDRDTDDANDRVRVGFAVRTKVVGQPWDITMFRAARRFREVVKNTRAPAGNVRVRVPHPEDADATYHVNALNLVTGEECRARLVWRDT